MLLQPTQKLTTQLDTKSQLFLKNFPIKQDSNSLQGQKKKKIHYIKVEKEKDFLDIWNIFESEFPSIERRTKDHQFSLLQKENYTLRAYKNELNETVAILSFWILEKYLFIEHFAVNKSFQSGGFGSSILREFLSESFGKQIFLEVEDPKYAQDKQIAERRIMFYQRLGFTLNPSFFFSQPPYHNACQDTVKLLILSHSSPIQEDFEPFLKKLLKVYQE